MDEISALKEAEKEQARTVEPQNEQNWAFPIMLIVFGTVFLLSNLGIFTLHNWWALFFLFPAASSVAKAFAKWQVRGRITRGVRRHLAGALIWSIVGAIFLFGLNWGMIWPILLIIWGLSALFQALE